jgi:hypothetical protein
MVVPEGETVIIVLAVIFRLYEPWLPASIGHSAGFDARADRIGQGCVFRHGDDDVVAACLVREADNKRGFTGPQALLHTQHYSPAQAMKNTTATVRPPAFALDVTVPRQVDESQQAHGTQPRDERS